MIDVPLFKKYLLVPKCVVRSLKTKLIDCAKLYLTVDKVHFTSIVETNPKMFRCVAMLQVIDFIINARLEPIPFSQIITNRFVNLRNGHKL